MNRRQRGSHASLIESSINPPITNEPKRLIAIVSHGKLEPNLDWISPPSQYRALAPNAPPSAMSMDFAKDSIVTARPPCQTPLVGAISPILRRLWRAPSPCANARNYIQSRRLILRCFGCDQLRRSRAVAFAEDDLTMIVQIGDDMIAVAESSIQQLFAQRVFDELLHRAPQRPCAHIGLIPFAGQHLFHRIGQRDLQPAARCLFVHAFHHQVYDLENLFARKVRE